MLIRKYTHSSNAMIAHIKKNTRAKNGAYSQRCPTRTMATTAWSGRFTITRLGNAKILKMKNLLDPNQKITPKYYRIKQEKNETEKTDISYSPPTEYQFPGYISSIYCIHIEI